MTELGGHRSRSAGFTVSFSAVSSPVTTPPPVPRRPSLQELWRLKITKGGRILFEVAVEYDEESRTWAEMIRLWVRGWAFGAAADRVRVVRRSVRGEGCGFVLSRHCTTPGGPLMERLKADSRGWKYGGDADGVPEATEAGEGVADRLPLLCSPTVGEGRSCAGSARTHAAKCSPPSLVGRSWGVLWGEPFRNHPKDSFPGLCFVSLLTPFLRVWMPTYDHSHDLCTAPPPLSPT
jgi:hypothetical protein